MDFSNWKVAKVVHAVPERGWGLAEMNEGGTRTLVFLLLTRAVTFFLKGTELVSTTNFPNKTSFLMVGTEIAFEGLLPAQGDGKYLQAKIWTAIPREHLQKLEVSRAKAIATLARLKEENDAREAARRADMEMIGSRRSSKGNRGGKKKQKAHANA